MLIINERVTPQVAPELLDRLGRIPPATIGHILHFGFMDPALRPTGRRGFIVCGPAVTVRAMAIDNAVVHHAIALAQPGDVLVIDRNGDRKHACWGEMTALAAHTKGLSATIVDGPLTDVVEIEDMGYVTFSRGVSPITTRSSGTTGEINTVVQCGGVSVAPGDIILADDNGILVLPPSQVAELVERCEPVFAREPDTRARIRAGEELATFRGATARLMATLEAQRQGPGH